MRNLLIAVLLGFGSLAVADPVPIDTHKEEEIHIDQKIVPPRMPELTDRGLIPSYSETARMENAWVVSYVWLDIDERGTVQRMKFIKRPGHDLDQIAIDFALSRQFKPARNQFDHPTRALVHFELEWPSYDWLIELKRSVRRLPTPADLHGVSVTGEFWSSKMPPCAHEASWNFESIRPRITRDCSKPDLSHASAAERWYERKH